MAYENQCGSCSHFEDFNPRRSSALKKYHCDWYGAYYYPDDTCVGDGDHYRYRGYITTMVCSRLGLDKENDVYKTITGFQKNVMENDKKYNTILDDYDIVGPKIAKELETEDIGVIQRIYNVFLEPTAELLNNNKSEQAVFKYRQMIEILRGHYGIRREKSTSKIATGSMKVLAVKKNI